MSATHSEIADLKSFFESQKPAQVLAILHDKAATTLNRLSAALYLGTRKRVVQDALAKVAQDKTDDDDTRMLALIKLPYGKGTAVARGIALDREESEYLRTQVVFKYPHFNEADRLGLIKYIKENKQETVQFRASVLGTLTRFAIESMREQEGATKWMTPEETKAMLADKAVVAAIKDFIKDI